MTLIEAAAILGMAIGSLSCGNFIKNGRRKTYLIFNFLGIFTIIPQMIENPISIAIGRFLFGFCSATICNAGTKMIDEIVPVKQLGKYGAATSIFMTLGMLNSIILGLLLPSSIDYEGQLQNETWRILYGFPIIY